MVGVFVNVNIKYVTIYLCMYKVCMSIYVNICTHMYIYVHICVFTCRYTICIYINIHVTICIYIYM